MKKYACKIFVECYYKYKKGEMMDKKELINRYKSGERNFSGAEISAADLSAADLSAADLRGANLSNTNLEGADLGSANLRKADLWNANLSNTNLEGADLEGASFWKANLWNSDLSFANLSIANLSIANLSFANLRRVNLRRANLSFANLSFANLSFANLSEANLSAANLSIANLSIANLSRANLSRANLGHANLSRTVLDPENTFDPIFDEEFLRAGFEVEGGRVIGYRTKRSTICGNTQYVPGETYTAPVFSTDTETECHPGIYLAPLKWMKREYKGWSLVKVSAAIHDVLRCGDKWRARKIIVIEDYEEK